MNLLSQQKKLSSQIMIDFNSTIGNVIVFGELDLTDRSMIAAVNNIGADLGIPS